RRDTRSAAGGRGKAPVLRDDKAPPRNGQGISVPRPVWGWLWAGAGAPAPTPPGQDPPPGGGPRGGGAGCGHLGPPRGTAARGRRTRRAARVSAGWVRLVRPWGGGRSACAAWYSNRNGRNRKAGQGLGVAARHAATAPLAACDSPVKS